MVTKGRSCPPPPSAMQSALGLWNHHPDSLRELLANGMTYDYSRSHPGQDYANIYEWVRHK